MRKLLSLMFTIALPVSGQIWSVSDNFNDDTMDTSLWVNLAGGLAETNQHLELYPYAGPSTWQFKGGFVSYYWNCNASIDIRNITSVSNGASATTGLKLADTGNNSSRPPSISFDFFVEDSADRGRGLRSFMTAAGSPVQTGLHEVIIPDLQQVRLRVQLMPIKKIVYLLYSTNSTDWIQFASYGTSPAGGGATANLDWAQTSDAMNLTIEARASNRYESGDIWLDNFSAEFFHEEFFSLQIGITYKDSKVNVTWPTYAGGRIQYNAGIGRDSVNNWQFAPDPTIDGGNYIVSFPATLSAQFFRWIE